MSKPRRPPRDLRRRALGLLLAAALAAPVHAPLAQVRLPSLGEGAAEDFSVGTERRLGEQIMQQVRRDPAYFDDPVLQEYLQTVWAPLVQAARERGDVEPDVDRSFAWEAFLVLDRSVNAFALPGGFVGVHLGLIAMTDRSDELASVLAHELSHVTQRHIARGIVNSQRASMAGLAGLLLGVLAASRADNVDVANAAIMGGQAVAVQGQLNFSRDMEREADRNGFALMRQAGFASSGMSSMFEKLDSANRINDSGAFPYLRSHPLTIDRVSEARSRSLLLDDVHSVPPLRHVLMQQRAKVLMDGSVQTRRRFEAQAAGLPGAPLGQRLGALYAGALAAALLREPERAQALAAQALALAQSAPADVREDDAERLLRLLQAELALTRGDAGAALATLDEAARLHPRADARAPMLLRAQAGLDLQHQGGAAQAVLRDSTEALQTWVADHRQDAGAWDMLGQTAAAVGMQLRSLRAAAEARAVSGDLRGAIDRLRAGQLAARSAAGQDFIEASVIDARLRELQAAMRELEREAREGF